MNQTYRNYEIIFIDAGSTDGSADYVQKNFPKIKIIECERIGIGEAINLGIKRSSGMIFSFDFNTDEYVFPDWLEELVKQLKKYKYNIITGTTRLIYKTNLIDEAGCRINYLGRGKKIGHKKDIDTFKFVEEPVTHVGSPTFHRDILKKTGPVDEEYHIYYEDIDFCHRAKLVGIKTFCAPLARSFHHISGTIGASESKYEYFLKRALIRFQLIYFSPVRLLVSLSSSCLFSPIASLLRSLFLPKRFSFFSRNFLGNVRAVNWNIMNLKRTLRRRKQIQLLAN